MNCEQVAVLLDDHLEGRLAAAETVAVEQHLSSCLDCRAAVLALQSLTRQRRRPVPAPDETLLSRVIQLARPPMSGTEANLAGRQHTSNRIWWGAGLGSALAAGIAVAFLTVSFVLDGSGESEIPVFSLTMEQPRAVNIAIDSTQALAEAQITVTLVGDIGLAGFGDQSEITWRTDIEPGVNRLSLPMVLRGAAGGRLRVELEHELRTETFTVDLRREERGS